MRRRLLLTCGIFLSSALGCAEHDGARANPELPAAATLPAEVDPSSGEIVALRMHYTDHVEAVACSRPWAAWVEWLDHDHRVFRIYDRAAQTVTVTDDFDAFLECLASLPVEIEIERLDTCGCPRAWAMPDEAWRQMEQVMKEGGRSWAMDEFSETRRRIICICEVVRMEFVHR